MTCPTSTTGRPRSLAIAISPAATVRTCVTPPGPPCALTVDMVWMESTINIDGFTASTCPSNALSSLSAARYISPCRFPVRSARNRTCPADSSPVT